MHGHPPTLTLPRKGGGDTPAGVLLLRREQIRLRRNPVLDGPTDGGLEQVARAANTSPVSGFTPPAFSATTSRARAPCATVKNAAAITRCLQAVPGKVMVLLETTAGSGTCLGATFEELATGARVTVVVNHLKSKGSECGTGDDDTITGQGNCNGVRTQAAAALADWLATDPTGQGAGRELIMGDLNSKRGRVQGTASVDSTPQRRRHSRPTSSWPG